MAEEEKTEEKEEAAEEVKEEAAEEVKEEVAEEKAEEVKEESKAEEKVEEKPADQPTADQPKAGKPVEKPKPTGKFKDLIKDIEELSVSDLAELVKALEERFGVSASAAPIAVAGAGAGAGDAAAEEKSSYTVMLKDGGAQKIAVIKAVREINQDLGLVDAKNLVDGAPKEVKKDLPKAEAEEAKKKLEAAGATVELV